MQITFLLMKQNHDDDDDNSNSNIQTFNKHRQTDRENKFRLTETKLFRLIPKNNNNNNNNSNDDKKFFLTLLFLSRFKIISSYLLS